ncbi:pyridoxal phosphate-dependent aminotransferase family protein [Streptomyces sp. NPDC051183]|uniref:aminotransferase class I/II-fold pyridoxal phosphate-dependent enzyme n=1 Tax=unclassified Streptomyces TaxID=2593676 RepID=UPI00342F1304
MSSWIASSPALDALIAQGDAYPYYRVIEGRPAPGEIVVDGVRAVNAASTDYLGLAFDPQVRAAAALAAGDLGTSCSGSAITNGTIALHRELEEELADFLQRPAVMLAPTGFQANLALAHLLGVDHTVVADQHNHASLVDAASLSRAEHRRFGHNDTAHAERLLRTAVDKGRAPVILTEGAFSLGGDLCALPQLAELAGRYGAGLIVDGAHDIGVLGANGRGAAEHFGVEAAVDIVTGTFSKAFGSVGGFVAGPDVAVRELRHFGRAAVYSASMPPPAAAAALAAVRIVRADPKRRAALRRAADHLHRGLAELGHGVPAWAGPVVALPAGEPDRGSATWRALLDAGVFAAVFRPPAVPGDQAVVRVSVTASHTADQVDRILDVIARHLPLPTDTDVDAAHETLPGARNGWHGSDSGMAQEEAPCPTP